MTAPTYEPLTEEQQARFRSLAIYWLRGRGNDENSAPNLEMRPREILQFLATIDAERARALSLAETLLESVADHEATLAQLHAERAAREAAEASVAALRVRLAEVEQACRESGDALLREQAAFEKKEDDRIELRDRFLALVEQARAVVAESGGARPSPAMLELKRAVRGLALAAKVTP